MSGGQAFYVTCAAVFGVGLLVTLLGAMLSGYWEDGGNFVMALGFLCCAVAPIMAMIGPQS